MSATDVIATNTTGLPVGIWKLDPTHSSASFAVKHMGVATFRGRFEKFNATLTVDESSAGLVGTVDASSIVVKDENLQGHLGSPDFFDVERYPEITFRSASLRREGDEVIVDGELTIKGNTRAVEARGEIAGPAVTLGEVTKVGLTLETIVDRTEFGLNWNAPLPRGGFAVANVVKLTVELELIQG
ncbi:MAG: YceI family protein [Solirubrobacterales bacterium]|nr:YceI family protein [Solirubrobacterales bacterium]